MVSWYIMLFEGINDENTGRQTDETFEIVYGKPISYCLCIVAFPTHLTLLFSGCSQVMKILRYVCYKYLNRFHPTYSSQCLPLYIHVDCIIMCGGSYLIFRMCEIILSDQQSTSTW